MIEYVDRRPCGSGDGIFSLCLNFVSSVFVSVRGLYTYFWCDLFSTIAREAIIYVLS